MLLRGPTEIQIGLDPPTAVVLHVRDADPVARLLRQLDGSHTREELEGLSRATGALDDDVVGSLLAALTESGLLAEGPWPDQHRWTASRMRLIGAGPIARRVAEQVVAAGVGTLVLFDDRPAGRFEPNAPTRAHALRLRLVRRHPDARVSVVNHWSKPEQGCDLTVVAADTLECDRGLIDSLLRADQLHLLVRPGERGAVVGPAVRPGRSACLQCLDLTRRDLDPAWPRLLPQLVRRPGEAGPAAVAWAAATTTTQVLALLGGAAAATLGATVELSDDDHLVRTRRWRVHPSCGCHWGQTAEWGP